MFEDPEYDFDDSYSMDPGMDYEGNGGSKLNIKKLLPSIIIAVIAIVILIFVLGYFGSQREVTFSINEIGGGIVENPNFTLRDSEGNRIKLPTKGKGTTHTITLLPGVYTYTASSPNHKPKTGSITVNTETNDTETVSLIRDIDAKIQINMDQQKDIIYEGQEFSGKIIITNENEGDPIEDVEVEAESEYLEIILDGAKIGSFSGATAINFTFSIKENIDEEMEAEGTISIEGTKIDEDFTIKIKAAVPLEEIDLSGFRSGILREDDLKAGEDFTASRVSLDNDSDNVSLNNVHVQITADNGFENELEWIKFTTYSNSKQEMDIDNIPAGEEKDLSFIVTPPVYAEVGDRFEGVLKITSPSMQEDIENRLIFIVDEESKVKIELDGRTDFDFECVDGVCEEVDTINVLSLENSGDVTITNIQLEVLTEAPADTDCAMLLELGFNTITSLSPGEEEILSFDIHTTPTTEKPSTECYLTFEYDDPLNVGTKTKTRSHPLKIEADISTTE